MEFEVNSVQRRRGQLGHEAIIAIGNDLSGWCLSEASAIHRLVNRRDTLYVRDLMTGRRVYLTVVRDKRGRYSLRTMMDGRATNHLLALKQLQDCALID